MISHQTELSTEQCTSPLLFHNFEVSQGLETTHLKIMASFATFYLYRGAQTNHLAAKRKNGDKTERTGFVIYPSLIHYLNRCLGQ